jgi:hypothetical protein
VIRQEQSLALAHDRNLLLLPGSNAPLARRTAGLRGHSRPFDEREIFRRPPVYRQPGPKRTAAARKRSDVTSMTV